MLLMGIKIFNFLVHQKFLAGIFTYIAVARTRPHAEATLRRSEL